MWGKYIREQADLFATQFEQLDGRLVYRRFSKGEAYPVTAPERDAFITAYARFYVRLMLGMFAGILAVVGISLLPGYWERLDLVPWVLGAGIALVVVPMFVLLFRAYAAPQRVLSRRAAIAAPLNADERHRRWSQQVSWSGIVIAGIAGVALIVPKLLKYDVLHGWARVWLVLPLVFFGVLGWAVWRKWRIDRTSR